MSGTGYKPMSVPDRIQLSGGGPDYKQAPFRTMMVPEKITLGASSNTNEGNPTNLIRGGVNETTVPPTAVSSSEQRHHIPVANPVIKSDLSEERSGNSSHDLRLDSIEERLQAVEEKLSHTHLSSGPSNFWYALTFSTWVMVPLIVVYLVYYKKHS